MPQYHFYPRSPCGERQRSRSAGHKPNAYFYPRSPCGERPLESLTPTQTKKFLSTLSLRRATVWPATRRGVEKHFYPRSPCGERRCISRSTPVQAAFLSTLSLRRATTITLSLHPLELQHFYPRSPCGERPGNITALQRSRENFYPRSPCGERQQGETQARGLKAFLSTLSLRRATCQWRRSVKLFRHFYPRSPCGERHRR